MVMGIKQISIPLGTPPRPEPPLADAVLLHLLPKKRRPTNKEKPEDLTAKENGNGDKSEISGEDATLKF